MTSRPAGFRYTTFFIVGFLFSLVGQVCAEANFEGKMWNFVRVAYFFYIALD